MSVARNCHCLAWSYSSVTEEDELAVRAGGCPFRGNSGHQQIFVRDGSVARDPNRSFAAKFRRSAAVAAVLPGTVAWTLEILVAVNVFVGRDALIAI
jgi:hypothetical protein